MDTGANWLEAHGRSRAEGSPECREVEQIDRAVTVVVQVVSVIRVAVAAKGYDRRLAAIAEAEW
jgi:hypothetical protein